MEVEEEWEGKGHGRPTSSAPPVVLANSRACRNFSGAEATIFSTRLESRSWEEHSPAA